MYYIKRIYNENLKGGTNLVDDNKLSQDIKKDREEALDNLVDTYGKLIYGVIASVMIPNHMQSEVDECFNEILINIWTKIESFDSKKGKFRNWIITLSKYKALDYLRKKKDYAKLKDTNINANYPIEEEIVNKEEKEILRNAIISLEEIDREIFTLRFLEDLEIDEISKRLKIEKGTIYTRISRGKKKLRKIMEGYYE